MKNENGKCERPCGTCPFRTVNHNKPNPVGVEKLRADYPDFKIGDWYSTKNITRLWKKALSTGTPMLCHSSDPNASEYGGRDAKKGIERVCLGLLIPIFKHIKYQEDLLKKGFLGANLNRLYRQKAGKYPMSKRAVSEWLMMFAFGRTDLMGGLEIPRVIDGKAIEEVSVPWLDEIVNEKEVQNELKFS